MELKQIQAALTRKFSRNLSPGTKRQVVFWYDDDGTFSRLVDQLDLESVKIWRLESNNSFATKYQLEVADPGTDYLIYADFPRPVQQDNWLLDTLLYSTEFSADWASIVMNDLGVQELSLKPFIKKNINFFDNKDRYQVLKNLFEKGWIKPEFELGMMAVACREKTLQLESIVKALLLNSLDEGENAYWAQIGKWPGHEVFWESVGKEYGFYHEKPTFKKLLLTFIMTYTRHTGSMQFPPGWQQYVSSRKANCIVFIDHWMSHRKDSKKYDQLAGEIARELQLSEQIMSWQIEDYRECDSFDVFDKGIILNIINSIQNGGKDYEKYLELIGLRKTKHWYQDFEHVYEAVDAAVRLLQFGQENASGFPGSTAGKFFESYKKEYYLADYYYRKFYTAYDKTVQSNLLKQLRQIVENYYDNGFLQNLSPAWSEVAERELSDYWPIPALRQQKDFYKDHIQPVTRKSRDVIYVIISDALRYEAALELADRLNAATRGSAELTAMQGIVPSYTRLAMACMLPWEKIAIDPLGAVLVDGVDSQGTVSRDKILKNRLPQSRALPLNELLSLKKEESRELLRGSRVIYIYHNIIDATGDKAATEVKAFAAVADTLDELERAIKYITNNLGGTNILITADHGFIYKRDPLVESDKVCREKDSVLAGNRRFIISESDQQVDGTVRISLKYLLGQDTIYNVIVPRGVSRFKTQGAGALFVHGGASLQEIVVPLIKYRLIKTSITNKETIGKVNVELTNTIRKITNNAFTLSFFQTEKVDAKILPRTLRVALWDENGEKISTEAHLIADKTSDRADERTFKTRLVLRGGTYDRHKKYELKLIDEELAVEYRSIPFEINLGITNDFDDF